MKLLLIQRLASACLCMNIGKGGHGTVNLPLELYHDCPTKINTWHVPFQSFKII